LEIKQTKVKRKVSHHGGMPDHLDANRVALLPRE